MGRTRHGLARERGLATKLGWRAALAAAGMTLTTGAAQAAAQSDCSAVNRGAMNVELADQSTTTRRVDLKPGDTLTFNFEAATAGPFGTLTLRQGAGAPRSLLVGPTGTSVSFVAAKKGAFDFEFGKEGAEVAAFAVTCVPAAEARRDSAAASRRRAKLLGTAVPPADVDTSLLAGVVLDPGAAPTSPRKAAPWADDAQAPAAADVLTPGSPLDVSMQWRGGRYRAFGPDGIEIDTTAAGVDATLKYRLLPDIVVGALAQVDQPGETLIGPPPSLSEQGWMAGPVTKLKLAPGLSLDAKAAWGVADVATDELATRAVSASRRMISARLANTQSFGPWRFSPSISVNHFQTAGAAPGAETEGAAATGGTSLGRVDVGPEIAYRIDMNKAGFIEPRAVLGSFWEIDSLSHLGPGSGHGDLRLKAEAGVTIGTTDGTKLQATGGVEEGAPGAADVWSGRVQFSVPMK